MRIKMRISSSVGQRPRVVFEDAGRLPAIVRTQKLSKLFRLDSQALQTRDSRYSGHSGARCLPSWPA